MPSLRQSLRRLWQQGGRVRDLLGLSRPQKAREPGDGRAAARARFWDGVREGRREAEAQCSRREP